jgi:hypothetical protein
MQTVAAEGTVDGRAYDASVLREAAIPTTACSIRLMLAPVWLLVDQRTRIKPSRQFSVRFPYGAE